jgi:phosphonate metabolism-associated iron-containing alcohol dehydrogenase
VASGPWEQHNPVRILFGSGRLEDLPRLVQGAPVLVVTTRGATARGLTDRVSALLGSPLIHDEVESNPSLDSVERAIGTWVDAGIRQLVAVGGGSAMDVAKVLSLGLADRSVIVPGLIEPDHPWASVRPLPLVTIPTTAGTGAEVTPFATVWDSRERKKHSVGGQHLHPTAAIVDPELTVSLPWAETLSTGLDAYSQCFEAVCSRDASPISTLFAERGIHLVPDALRALRHSPTSLDARTAMAEAALLSGLAISQTKTGLAHSMSYPITAHLGVPHGLACALSLPGVLAYNSELDDGRMAGLSERLGLASADSLAPTVVQLFRDVGAPETLRSLVGNMDAVRALADEMLTPGRADANFIPVDAATIGRVLEHTADWLGSEGP